MNYGTIFIIATPIGNLGDITLRALDTLKSVNFILCEDTRVTKVLLDHYSIKKDLDSFNAQTEEKKIPLILDRIKNGQTCAVISDAGTPGISDPGVRLINAAIKSEINVVTIPGASALTAALSIAGLPTDSFVFEGFIPQKKGRQKLLQELANERRTIVLYESVYRIEKLLTELSEYMPNRFVVVCRELTKKFEETWRGYPKDMIAELPNKTIKGEFVIIIAPIGWRVTK